jgi:hypothetical protein
MWFDKRTSRGKERGKGFSRLMYYQAWHGMAMCSDVRDHWGGLVLARRLGLGKKYLDFAFLVRNTTSRRNYSVSVPQPFPPLILLVSSGNIRAILRICFFFSF